MRTPEKPALTRLDRIARAVALVAWTWFTLAIAWGMFGRAQSGHYASMAATGISARSDVRSATTSVGMSDPSPLPNPLRRATAHLLG